MLAATSSVRAGTGVTLSAGTLKAVIGAAEVSLAASGITSDADGEIGYGGTAPTGTDQTSAVQAVVTAVGATGGVVRWDVAVGLSAPILVPSNVTIYAPGRQFGAIMRAASNCPMFRNVGITTDNTVSRQRTFGKLDPDHPGNAAYRVLDVANYMNDRNLGIKGGTWNGNRSAQTGVQFTSTHGFCSLVQFWGVENPRIEDAFFLNAFAAVPVHFANWFNLRVYDCWYDGSPIDTSAVGGPTTTGAFQLQGPGEVFDIDGLTTHCTDDHVALNADDSGAAAINSTYAGGASNCTPGVNWTQCGDIRHGSVRNLRLWGGAENVRPSGCVRLLSTVHAIDDVEFDGISGDTCWFAHTIGSIGSSAQINGTGNLGKITFRNDTVELYTPDNGAHGVGRGVFDIDGGGPGPLIIEGRIRGTVPASGVPDVYKSSQGGLTRLEYQAKHYDREASPVAVPQILVAGTCSLIKARTQSDRDGSPASRPVLLTAGSAAVYSFIWDGEIDGSPNVVKHAAGSLSVVQLSGFARGSSGGSPLDVATGLTVASYDKRRLVYNSLVAAKSGSGSVTLTDDYQEATTYAQDGFGGSNGTQINGRTPDTVDPGATWATFLGTAANSTVQGNKAQFAPNNTSEGVVLDTGHADGTITVSMTLDGTANTTGIVIFRAVDADNYWQIIAANNSYSLYKYVSGTPTQVGGTQSATISANTPYTVTIVLSGNSISAVWGSNTPIATTDSTHASATKHGAAGYNSVSATVLADDFLHVP